MSPEQIKSAIRKKVSEIISKPEVIGLFASLVEEVLLSLAQSQGQPAPAATHASARRSPLDLHKKQVEIDTSNGQISGILEVIQKQDGSYLAALIATGRTLVSLTFPPEATAEDVMEGVKQQVEASLAELSRSIPKDHNRWPVTVIPPA